MPERRKGISLIDSHTFATDSAYALSHSITLYSVVLLPPSADEGIKSKFLLVGRRRHLLPWSNSKAARRAGMMNVHRRRKEERQVEGEGVEKL